MICPLNLMIMHQYNFCTQSVLFAKRMLFSETAKVGDLSARESHRIEENRNNKICAAMEVLEYGAEKVSTIKHCQFQVRLNTI
jgi:hypothetical protein